MARAKSAAPATKQPATQLDPSMALLAAALGKRDSNSDRLMDVVADETANVINGSTEVIARSFGGVGTVWDAGRAAGKIDGIAHAKRLLARSADRAGLTVEQATQLLAVL